MSKVIHNPRNTRIFVSYSKDNDFVKRFVNDLCYVLDDKDAADVDWWLEITRQITARKVFVLILSPDALKSPWVPEEILMAYRGEKSKTSTKKKFIVIHFRECKHEIPNTLNFLHDRQWIQCSTLKTYQAVLYELLKTLNIPINARITNYIRTLDLWDLEAFVRPKANADFSEKEREEYLNVLGKYNVVYIQQDRWDEVLVCAKEALSLVSNDPHWLTIKTQAIDHLARIRLSQTDSAAYTNNKSFSSNNARKSGSTQALRPKDLYKESSDTPNTSRKSAQSTQQTFSRSRSDVTQRKSVVKASQSQFVTAAAPTAFSQRVKVDIGQRNSKKKNGQNYLVNFADFMSKFIRVSNGFFYLTCGIDVLILPFILGLLLYSYYWQAVGACFLFSFLTLIIGPVTKNRRVAISSVVVFSASWALSGWILGRFVNIIINSFLSLFNKSSLQSGYILFPIVLSSLFLLFSFSLHLVIVFCTNHLVKSNRSAKASS